MNHRVRKLITSGLIYGFIVIWILMILVVVWNRGRYLEGVAQSPEELRADYETLLLAETIPSEATDIHYHVHPYSQNYEASFRITEEEFLQWAHQLESSALVETNANGESVPTSKLEEISDNEMPSSFFYETKGKRTGGRLLNPGYILHHIRTKNLQSIVIAFRISGERAYVELHR